MNRILHSVVALAVLAMLCCILPGCAVTSGGHADDSKVQAAKAYLDSTITRIKADVATLKERLPAKLSAIEATVEPAVSTLEKLVSAYDGAALAKDIGMAESVWSAARTAVTTVVGVLASLGV